MIIALIGTGTVGQALARGFTAAGHEVRVGTREPDRPRTVAAFEGVPVALMTSSEALLTAEIAINATAGLASIDALTAAGIGAVDGIVLLDTSNPLDFSGGFPPKVANPPDSSLGERIQHAFPDARVVKALCTLSAALMTNPGGLPERTNLFIAGDDAQAKDQVTTLLGSVGWLPEDIWDLGGIIGARALEGLIPFWLSLMAASGSPGMFNYRIVVG